ncbi:MAG: hypothetical protein IKV54_02540 [Clostridia bacterium]|nr:hypothetical protein [Clostridia bacterium]
MKKNSIGRLIWLSALILFIASAATTVALASRLNPFMPDDSGAIVINRDPAVDSAADTAAKDSTSDTAAVTDATPIDTTAADTGVKNPDKDTAVNTAPDTVPADSSDWGMADTVPSTHGGKPGIEASDDLVVWETMTEVEIFKVSYENGEGTVTVLSDNGEKILAPGTENSYTFKLKNTGDTALDYTLLVEAFFEPVYQPIPIEARLSRYDGKWVVGDKDRYDAVGYLDGAEDTATLGAGKYNYYTLDWRWPFESGSDLLDTSLGDLALTEDITFTIVLKIVAEISEDPENNSGILPPQTGDGVNLILVGAVASGSFILMLFMLFTRRGKKGYVPAGER